MVVVVAYFEGVVAVAVAVAAAAAAAVAVTLPETHDFVEKIVGLDSMMNLKMMMLKMKSLG